MQTDRLLAAMIANGALANGANPALLAAGLNIPIIGGGAGGIGGGAGLIGQPQIGQPQFAQVRPMVRWCSPGNSPVVTCTYTYTVILI